MSPLTRCVISPNHSSGKQGHALAEACAKAGAKVTLVSGPVHIPDPEGPDTEGVKTIHVTTAQEMYDACITALPADCAICAAAVADWQVVNHGTQKMKKTKTGIPKLELAENPDILASLSQHRGAARFSHWLCGRNRKFKPECTSKTTA
jgi:phosphopantothenoylcysteine decarboxylase/phosphopantothenate--cysteine ligase